MTGPRQFVVMLARQRSGTNPLRSVLDTHPDVFCTPEIFHDNPSAETHLDVELNFFRFVAEHPKGGERRVLSFDDQLEVFVDFLRYVSGFTDKRVIVFDVKYNSTHHLNPAWKYISAEPTLFAFIRSQHLYLMNLTRRNFLRWYLSQQKAERTQAWTARADGTARPDEKIRIDTAHLLRELELCRGENAIVERSLAHHERYLTFDYEELFSGLDAPMSPEILERIAAWLQLPNAFRQSPEYRKQSSLTLEESIENYAEVEEALRGTPFEYCLADEAMYRSAGVS